MIEGVRSCLIETIRLRLRADVKVAIALNGGIDSSAVAGIVNHLMCQGEKLGSDTVTERLNCFCIAFDEDSGFDELGRNLSIFESEVSELIGYSHCKQNSRLPRRQLLQKHMDEQALADYSEDATCLCEQLNADLKFCRHICTF